MKKSQPSDANKIIISQLKSHKKLNHKQEEPNQEDAMFTGNRFMVLAINCTNL